MIGLWLFPPVVAIGMVAVTAAVRSAAREASRLGEELGEFARLRPALVELQEQSAVARGKLDRVRSEAAAGRWSGRS